MYCLKTRLQQGIAVISLAIQLQIINAEKPEGRLCCPVAQEQCQQSLLLQNPALSCVTSEHRAALPVFSRKTEVEEEQCVTL